MGRSGAGSTLVKVGGAHAIEPMVGPRQHVSQPDQAELAQAQPQAIPVRREGCIQDARDFQVLHIVTIAILAKLAGSTKVEAIADWATLRCQELHHLFGTPRTQMPYHTTWSRILGYAIDVVALEQLVQQFLTPPPVGEVPDRASIVVALDGKTIRGTIPRGQCRGVHLLAAYAPTQGVVLFQVAVDRKENEIVAAPVVLQHLALRGTLITGDAMVTQRALRIQIVDAGGDSLWMVKDNQPSPAGGD